MKSSLFALSLFFLIVKGENDCMPETCNICEECCNEYIATLGLCDTCVSDNCPLPSSSPTSPNLPRNCCLFLDEKDYVTQSCFSADFECEDFPVPGWIFLHQFILYEDECRHLCHPPSPSPTPSPPTALTPPTPTPTPTKLLSNCCVFATPDFTVKQCLSFHDPCPSLPNWELLLESLRYEEECQELCFPPTPSPTPTPTPTPTSNFESPLRLMFVGITPNEGQSKVTWSYYITSGSVSDPEATNDLFYVELAICKFYTDESQYEITVVGDGGSLVKITNENNYYYAIQWVGLFNVGVAVSISGPGVFNQTESLSWYQSKVGTEEGRYQNPVRGPGCKKNE